MATTKRRVVSYRRTTIRKSPYGYWVVTYGTTRATTTFPTGETAIRAVEYGIKHAKAKRVIEDLKHQNIRGTRSHRLRQRLAVRDGGHCHYCKKLLDPIKRTIDHVVPKSLGGPSSFDNYVLACDGCNRKKGQQVRPTHCEFCATACDLYWDNDVRPEYLR